MKLSRLSSEVSLLVAVAILSVLASVSSRAQPVGGASGAAGGASGAAGGASGAAGGASGGGAVPWEGVKATGEAQRVELPWFLKVEKQRLRDERRPPTEEQVKALRQMQQEFEGFYNKGSQFEETVDAFVRREYLRRRRLRDEFYSRQIRREESLQARARDGAIAKFERFIAQYPNQPKYTPDAMFRLGELYYERSAIQFQESYAQAAQTGEAPAIEMPDFSPTIAVYQQLIERFPDYRNISAVYYLVAYCHNEMGEVERAKLAWLNLVCANRFTYTSASEEPVEGESEGATEPESASEQDAPSSMTRAQLSQAIAADPYGDCKLVESDAQFVAETWLRVGEFHFDHDQNPDALAWAISAYSKVLSMPEDRNYNLALYKLAWSYYRASEYAQAIKHFGLLVDWSDQAQKRTGRAGSELRAEAVQYMGISLAYDDWDENQVIDTKEGKSSGIERLQQPGLVPQDRDWTVEIYYQLGSVYFDEAKYPEAIQAWQLALQKWPLHPRSPEIQNQIALAYSRFGEVEDAIAAKGKLSDYGEGSEWWNANLDNPAAQRKAEELAEDSLISAAIFHHQKAQQLRAEGVSARNVELIREAQEQYRLAARAYREYITRYPNSPQAYELQYNLADALFWSESYEEAAAEYAAVRDSNLDDQYLSESARRVVESLHRLIEQAEEQGALAVREEPPAAVGTPPRVSPVEMPNLLQRLAQSRELYLARVEKAHDSENVRDSYDYNNALLLYKYGYWPQAKERFRRIFSSRCSGTGADETGRIAWLDLRNMAVVEEDTEEVARLGQLLQQKQCSFGESSAGVNCTLAENQQEPQCLAGADLTNIKYQRAVNVFNQAEGESDATKKRQLYETAAQMLVKAVDEEPDHFQAPLALEKAAIAYERTDRNESAGRLYQRIIDQVGPMEAENAEEQQKLDAILANAHFRKAYNANRFFDYEEAVGSYRALADSKRFAASSDPMVKERRQDALVNSAKILEYQQEYARAAQYYERAAELLDDPAEKRAAEFRVAEMYFKRKQYPRALALMKKFIADHRSEAGAGELVVLANWRVAQAYEEQNRQRDHRRALDAVTQAHRSAGLEPGSLGSEYAAEAQFVSADAGMDDFEKLKIQPGRPRTLQAYVAKVTSEIERASAEAAERAKQYEQIPPYRRPKWTIAAYVRQGRVYEILAKAVLDTPFVMPSDMAAQIRRAPADAREDIRIQVEDRIRMVLDEKVRPIECLAVARYALAARASKAGSIDNAYTRQATNRLQAYGDERIAECVAEAARRDPTFSPYVQGEFTRAPQGRTRPISRGTVAPPLEEQ